MGKPTYCVSAARAKKKTGPLERLSKRVKKGQGRGTQPTGVLESIGRLPQAEAALRTLPSPLGERPIFHHQSAGLPSGGCHRATHGWRHGSAHPARHHAGPGASGTLPETPHRFGNRQSAQDVVACRGGLTIVTKKQTSPSISSADYAARGESGDPRGQTGKNGSARPPGTHKRRCL